MFLKSYIFLILFFKKGALTEERVDRISTLSLIEQDNHSADHKTAALLDMETKLDIKRLGDNPLHGFAIKPTGDPFAGLAKGPRDD